MASMTRSASGSSVAERRVKPATSANQTAVNRREGEVMLQSFTPLWRLSSVSRGDLWGGVLSAGHRRRRGARGPVMT